MDDTKQILAKLFLRYPSLATASREQMAAMMASYLETLRSFSSPVVSGACDAIRSKGGAFPPSADELFVECEKRQEASRKLSEWSGHKIDFNRYRLPAPEKHGLTAGQLADWTLIINGTGKYVLRSDENGNELRIPAGYPGAGKPAVYGYLTPAEARAAAEHRAARKQTTAPRSFHEAAE